MTQFILDESINRYEATLSAGTHISVSTKRINDDAHNRAVMSTSLASYADRLAEAKALIMEHPTIYRAKHNGFSVVVIGKKK